MAADGAYKSGMKASVIASAHPLPVLKAAASARRNMMPGITARLPERRLSSVSALNISRI